MHELSYVRERIGTWKTIMGMDDMDMTAINRRLKQLEKRYDRLVADYNEVLKRMQEEYSNARDV